MSFDSILTAVYSLDRLAAPVLRMLDAGLLLFGLGALGLLLLRRASATDRAFLARCIFLAVAAAPLIGLIPSLPINTSLETPAPLTRSIEVVVASDLSAPVSPGAAAEPLPLPGASARVGADAVLGSAAPSPWPSFWFFLVAIWMIGVAWHLGRLVCDVLAVRRLVRRGAPLSTGPWAESLSDLDARAPARLVASGEISVPMSWAPGVRRRGIVLVPEALLGAAPARRVAILAHELSHLEARDGLVWILARFLTALHWIDPFAWWLRRRLHDASERAADDGALRRGQSPAVYARELVGIAEGARVRALSVAPAMAGRGGLSRRIGAILDARRLRDPVAPVWRLGALGVVLAAALLSAGARQVPEDIAPLREAAEPRESSASDELLIEARERLLQLQDAETGAWRAKVGYKFNNRYQLQAVGVPHVGVSAFALRALIPGDEETRIPSIESAIRKARDWMISVQRDDGLLRKGETRLKAHGHAVATLARLHQKRPHEGLAEAVRKGVAFSLRAQNDDGGWRYEPRAETGDLLCTAAVLEGLTSARDAGFRVPKKALEEAGAFVRRCLVAGSGTSRLAGAFSYQAQKRARTTLANNAAGWATSLALSGQSEVPQGAVTGRLVRDFDSLGKLEPFDYLRMYALHHATELARRWDAKTGDADVTRALGRLQAVVRKRLVTLKGPEGGWEGKPGPGEAFTTAVACLALRGR